MSWPDDTTSEYVGASGPVAGLRLKEWTTVRQLALNPDLAFGELYMDGALQPDGCTVYELLDLVLLNTAAAVRHPVLRWRRLLQGFRGRLRQDNDSGRWRHGGHCDDLDGHLYGQLLDRDQQYSCAYFRSGDPSLDDAQLAKKRHIAAKLSLHRPGLTVLDIGCGWGGMALTLAKDYGARVTGLTLSSEQLAVAQARAEAAGLADRVRFKLMDYRSVRERYDRVVSVGMMEHVGIVNYDAFFRTVHGCLHDDGAALIHHIGWSEEPGAAPPGQLGDTVPGDASPALSEVLPAIGRSGLLVTDVEPLDLHCARTLRQWRERFARYRDGVGSLYDERFRRMFEFYLASAELASRWQGQKVFQIRLAPSQTASLFERERMGPAITAHKMAGRVAVRGGAGQRARHKRRSPARTRGMPSS